MTTAASDGSMTAALRESAEFRPGHVQLVMFTGDRGFKL